MIRRYHNTGGSHRTQSHLATTPREKRSETDLVTHKCIFILKISGRAEEKDFDTNESIYYCKKDILYLLKMNNKFLLLYQNHSRPFHNIPKDN